MVNYIIQLVQQSTQEEPTFLQIYFKVNVQLNKQKSIEHRHSV